MLRCSKVFSTLLNYSLALICLSTVLSIIWKIIHGDGNFVLNEKNTKAQRIMLPEAIDFMATWNSTRRSIFFIETSKTGTLNARQACAIESTARNNPNSNIFLILLDPPENPILMKQEMVQSVFRFHKNIQVLTTTTDEFLKNSPVENLKDLMWESKFATAHTSDVTRVLTALRFGGIYLDLDFIIQRSLEELPLNWVTIQDKEFCASGAFGLEKGSRIAREMLEYLSKSYSTVDYTKNGPNSFTRMLERECGVEYAKVPTDGRCRDLVIIPPEGFHAVPWNNWTKFYIPEAAPEVMKTVNQSFGVHFWNSLSQRALVQVGSDQAYSRLAREHCPRSYWNCDIF
ncbi:lactosylceramide 4-alpha-galactosyltransferase-like [Neocloeon triangulifer]|uniref:lactosylceramide 4-alpha-galactosyltransferase-like n=1 Tax=Neocloeon triangulifer TaxID=2078957 RepID=UPI00286F5B94|nr:lactosylceramide 4-alpha-galactosyltransferase-like [Neocloeon triangulifer]